MVAAHVNPVLSGKKVHFKIRLQNLRQNKK